MYIYCSNGKGKTLFLDTFTFHSDMQFEKLLDTGILKSLNGKIQEKKPINLSLLGDLPLYISCIFCFFMAFLFLQSHTTKIQSANHRVTPIMLIRSPINQGCFIKFSFSGPVNSKCPVSLCQKKYPIVIKICLSWILFFLRKFMSIKL